MKTLARMLTVLVLLLFGVAVLAQSTEEYLDIYQVQVKPEKRADFDAIAKKIADANRANSGDQWQAMESVYGDANVVTFVSRRKNYAEVESGMTSFNNAMSKAYGAGAGKMFNDFANCLAWSRSEIRRRRWDLSINAPADDAGRAKLVGETRYLRTITVHVRPGHGEHFEENFKMWKEARENSHAPGTVVVSESTMGGAGNVYYLTTLTPNFAAFDSLLSMKKVLGDDGYGKFQKMSADAIESTTSMISRFAPSISNVPSEIAAASPEFWNPKPMMAMKKPAGSKTVAEKGKEPKK